LVETEAAALGDTLGPLIALKRVKNRAVQRCVVKRPLEEQLYRARN
jgi:hypothetical protein